MSGNASLGVSFGSTAKRSRRKQRMARAVSEALESRKYLAVEPYALPITQAWGSNEGDWVGMEIDFVNASSTPTWVTISNGVDSPMAYEEGVEFTYTGTVGAYLSYPFSDNGQTATITFYDSVEENTFFWAPTLDNVAPTASLGSSGDAEVGETVTVSFTGQSDPSGVDTSAGFTYYFDFNNDSDFDDANEGGSSSASRVTTFGTVGTKTIRARVEDKNYGYTDYTTAVTVSEAPYEGEFLGTEGDDIILVEFRSSGGNRSVYWKKWLASGSPPPSYYWEALDSGASVLVDGLGGNDVLNIEFEDDYFHDNEEIHITVNGGGGEDTINIEGGPGYDSSNGHRGRMFVNGFKVRDEEWSEDGDFNEELGISGRYEKDILNVMHPVGEIAFDDGDKRIPPNPENDPVPVQYEGQREIIWSDEVHVDDTGFARWADTEWIIDSQPLDDPEFDEVRIAHILFRDGPIGDSAIINAGHNFDPIELTAGAGNDTLNLADARSGPGVFTGPDPVFDFYPLNNVTVNGGSGNDVFNVAPADATRENSRVVGILEGNAGHDLFVIGSLNASSPNLVGIGVGEYPDQVFKMNGGDGNDTVVYDDTGGDGWLGNNEFNYHKLFQFGNLEEGSDLNTSSNSSQGSIFHATFVEKIELHMQDSEASEETPISEVTVGNSEVPIHIFPTPMHDDIVVANPEEPVYIYPSAGLDDVTVSGSPNHGIPVTVNFEGNEGTVAIGEFIIHHMGTAIVNVGEGEDFTWTSLSMPDYAGDRGTLDVTSGNVTFDTNNQEVGNLIIRDDGLAEIDVDAAKGVWMASLDIETGGVLDIVSGTAILKAGGDLDVGDIRSLLYSGLNRANWTEDEGVYGNHWTGDGIRSSTAAASRGWGDSLPGHLGVAYGTADDFGITAIDTFTSLEDEIILRVAYYGDANLAYDSGSFPTNGYVSSTDQAIMGNNWTQSGKFWKHADFNYDGLVNAEDLYLFSVNYEL